MRQTKRNLKHKLELDGLRKSKLSLTASEIPPQTPRTHATLSRVHTHTYTQVYTVQQYNLIITWNLHLAMLLYFPPICVPISLLIIFTQGTTFQEQNDLFVRALLLLSGTATLRYLMCLLLTRLIWLNPSIIHIKTMILYICCIYRILFPVRSFKIPTRALLKCLCKSESSQFSFKTSFES